MSNSELNNTLYKLSSLSKCAKENKTFQFESLAHHLNVEFLKDCYNNLARNKAVGIDKVSWQDYNSNLDENLRKLVQRLKNKSFRPLPAKRVYIPKGNSETRPLGISTIENKIVESGISQILQSIYEMDFLDCSYGCRPKRNTHQALNQIDTTIMSKPVNHIVEADIKGFFDNVNHNMLIEFLNIRIKDSSLIFLIKRFLKAGYIDDNLLIKTDVGTPQGSIFSPLLANIFLHYVLDTWFEKEVKTHIRGYCELVRYADDFVCLVQYKDDANKIVSALYKRFNKYGLTLHPDKTRVFSFGRFERGNSQNKNRKANTFDFLGFTHFSDKTRKGYFKVGRKTAMKKFRAKIKELNIWLKQIRNLVPTKEWWKILQAKLRGHFQYYGVSGNFPSIKRYYSLALKMVHKWLNRRSQKKSMSWSKLYNYLTLYPLPQPSIKHNFYTLSHKFVS
ncbi:MAG: group II intron reverse transcriptase/maturase [Sulfurimonas sp.]|nr:group II intron reverse transcriptase/maturase [Sulfurimonas sp.]